MTFGRKLGAMVAVVAIASLSLLLVSGALMNRASAGAARIHIDRGVVVVGHAGGCFVQEGRVEAESGGSFFGGGAPVGTFVANLKVLGTDPDSPGGPCGVIRGTVTFEIHPHFAGLFGELSGTVTDHSGPKPVGDFTGAQVFGSYQIRHIARQGTGITQGEGDLNVTVF